MREFQWADVSNDVGMVRESRGGSFVELWLRHEGGNIPDPSRGEHPEATHMLTPDGARAVADALTQTAFEIDGKGSTVAELTAQLEQARVEIERLKGTPDAHGIKPCPFCGGKAIIDSIEASGIPDDPSMNRDWFVRCVSCAAEGPWFNTRGAAIERWNKRIGGE